MNQQRHGNIWNILTLRYNFSLYTKMTTGIKMKKTILWLFAAAVGSAFADDAAIIKQLHNYGLEQIEVSDSPIAGIRSVVTDRGVFYADKDGKYFFQGGLIKLTDKGPADITNQPLLGKLNALENEAIVYPAKNEKYAITVFFDTTCFYCRKLHAEVNTLNDLGITVRYLAFPRSGLDSKAARQMETVLNAKDKKQTFAELESGQDIAETPVDKVKKHYNLGLQFGVRGTPSIIFPDGSMQDGYISAEKMLQLLKDNNN